MSLKAVVSVHCYFTAIHMYFIYLSIGTEVSAKIIQEVSCDELLIFVRFQQHFCSAVDTFLVVDTYLAVIPQ